MKMQRPLSALLATSILLSSCGSTTLIQSSPGGAKLYLDGESVGQTPYELRDTKIIGTCTAVRLEKEGYETFHTNLCRNEEADVGAIIGGIFLLVPFLWTMKYKPMHSYELIPSSGPKPTAPAPDVEEQGRMHSKADRLRELKELLDEGILTKDEFDRQKEKILNEK